jgi:hypothetical protein
VSVVDVFIPLVSQNTLHVVRLGGREGKGEGEGRGGEGRGGGGNGEEGRRGREGRGEGSSLRS